VQPGTAIVSYNTNLAVCFEEGGGYGMVWYDDIIAPFVHKQTNEFTYDTGLITYWSISISSC
jgi:hypothetical protein